MTKEGNRMAQTRLVIADDESIIRMNLKETLVGLGYLVVGEAGDGVSVINLARELKPDLVLMDIKMPKLDGIQAAKILTEEKIAPVLLLTAYSDRDLVDRAKEAGVVNYVVKPFREAELLPAIEIALARYQEFLEMDAEMADLKETLDTRKIVERAKGILMDTQGLKEAEAFRKIQQLSMNTRKSMKEIAQAISAGKRTLGSCRCPPNTDPPSGQPAPQSSTVQRRAVRFVALCRQPQWRQSR
jgi:AmiR/NasT family two-component response regulator